MGSSGRGVRSILSRGSGRGARRSRRTRALQVGAFAVAALVVLVACEPEPITAPPPPPSTAPTTTTTTAPAKPECGSVDGIGPASYVATVEEDGRKKAVRFRADTDREREDALEDLRREGKRVVVVEHEAPVEALVIDDPYFGPAPAGSQPANGQWGVARVAAEAAWGSPLAQGQGVTVAVIDTGVQASHPGLAGRVLPGIDYVALPGYGYDGRVDPNGHGTHVAGTIAEVDDTQGGIGVAPQVSVLPVRVLGCSGGGSTTDVANGIYWAVDNGADVINLSLGTGSASDTIRVAVESAITRGVLVVAAGGNSGGGCTTPTQPGSQTSQCSSPLYPAAFSPTLPGLLAVAATTSTDARASFSNVNDYINIAAPGASIWSTLPNGYGYKSGTSMASPHVAAIAALALARCPGTTPAALADRLMAAVDDLGPTGWDPAFGTGLARADLAVAAPC